MKNSNTLLAFLLLMLLLLSTVSVAAENIANAQSNIRLEGALKGGYLTLVDELTVDSDVSAYKEILTLYQDSEAFYEAQLGLEQVLSKEILEANSPAECSSNLTVLEEKSRKYFSKLALQYVLLRCTSLLGMKEKATLYEHHIERLSEIITEKGDGSTKEQALLVATVDDAYSFLSISGYDIVDSLFVGGKESLSLYYLVLTKDEEGEEGYFYFTASSVLENMLLAQANDTSGNLKANRISSARADLLKTAFGYESAMLWLMAQGDSAAAIYLGDQAFASANESDISLAALYYLNAIENGSVIGANRYAHLITRYKLEESYEQAVDYLSVGVEKKECYSIKTLQMMYELSLGVVYDREIIDALSSVCTDEDKKPVWYRELARSFYDSDGALHSQEAAFKYWAYASELGEAQADYEVGQIYANGNGVDQDIEKALEYFKKAIDGGSIDALTSMSYWLDLHGDYIEDFGSPADYALRGAEENNKYAQQNLGYFYRSERHVKKDSEQSYFWYLKSAENGNQHSMRWVGLYYLLGIGTEVDIQQSVLWLEKAVALGEPESYAILGYIYEKGLAGEADLEKAKKYYEQGFVKDILSAKINYISFGHRTSGPYLFDGNEFEHLEKLADSDDLEGLTALGVYYRYGYIDGRNRKNWRRARKLIKKARKAGYPPAMYMQSAANLIDNAKRGEEARSLDIKNMEEASSKGHVDATPLVGDYYYAIGDTNNPSDPNWAKARDYYHKSAEQNEAAAMFRLGLLYENALGVDRSVATAIEWYKKAAALNYGEAANTLGVMLIDGKVLQKDPTQAIQYLESAAEAGYISSMRNLGKIYSDGRYTKRDLASAVEWYKRASVLHDKESILRLGELILTEESLGKNVELARAYFLNAAQRNSHPGMFWYARSFELLMHDEVAFDDIYGIYSKASEQGNAWAKNNMAVMHLKEQVKRSSEHKAYRLLDHAHKSGNHSATANLAWCMEHGVGTRKNIEQAMELYRRAADQGSPFALQRLIEVTSNENSKWYSPDAVAGYQELLDHALNNKIVITAASSMIELSFLTKGETRIETADEFTVQENRSEVKHGLMH